MTGMGQKWSWLPRNPTSAKPLKADIPRACWHVAKVPEAAIRLYVEADVLSADPH